MKYLAQRILQMIVIMTVLSIALFGLLSAMPGNPVDMLITSNPRIKPEDVVRLKKLRGLDKPWYVQYVRWIWGYNDSYVAPDIRAISDVEVTLDEQNNAQATIDVTPFIALPLETISSAQIAEGLQERDKEFWRTAIADPVFAAGLERKSSEQMLERLAFLNEGAYEDLLAHISQKALKNITVTGLDGATVIDKTVSKNFTQAGSYRVWFKVDDAHSLEAVGSFLVSVKTSVKTHNDLGNLSESVVRIMPIPTQVIDIFKTYKLNLRDYVQSSENSKLTFTLFSKDAGEINEEGIFIPKEFDKGQSIIQFSVHDEKGQSAFGAFALNYGPLHNPNRFNRGFIFSFIGDHDALGFSSAYKRPVYELLFGEENQCGNRAVEAGEMCDDGNLVNGDGCSNTCMIEQVGIVAKTENALVGWLVNSGRIGNTLQLMFPAILLSLLIALPLGIFCAYRQYSRVDYAINFLAFLGISLPVFWFAIMVMFLFAEKLQLLPASGMQSPGIHEYGLWAVVKDKFSHSVLPVCVLSIAYVGRWIRYMRASMLEVLPLDYIRTARAKGLGERSVVLKHALRNALIPVVTILALSIPALFGGAVLTETVFSWPGLGRLQYDAVMNSDYYVAIVVFLISAFLVMIGNLLADVLYVIVDPRIRHD